MELSKTDKIAAALHAFADGISLIDDRLANEAGHVEIKTIEAALEAGTLLFSTIKNVYKSQGKEFTINIPGPTGKILNLLLDLLDKEDSPKPE